MKSKIWGSPCAWKQRKQVCGSEGMVVGWAGTLLLCALAIILFCYFIGSVIVARSLLRLCLTVGGMKSLGITGYFPVKLHRTWCVAESLNNHLNPNVLYRVLCVRVLFGMFPYCFHNALSIPSNIFFRAVVYFLRYSFLSPWYHTNNWNTITYGCIQLPYHPITMGSVNTC